MKHFEFVVISILISAEKDSENLLHTLRVGRFFKRKCDQLDFLKSLGEWTSKILTKCKNRLKTMLIGNDSLQTADSHHLGAVNSPSKNRK